MFLKIIKYKIKILLNHSLIAKSQIIKKIMKLKLDIVAYPNTVDEFQTMRDFSKITY
jgi:hypothetical protein